MLLINETTAIKNRATKMKKGKITRDALRSVVFYAAFKLFLDDIYIYVNKTATEADGTFASVEHTFFQFAVVYVIGQNY